MNVARSRPFAPKTALVYSDTELNGGCMHINSQLQLNMYANTHVNVKYRLLYACVWWIAH